MRAETHLSGPALRSSRRRPSACSAPSAVASGHGGWPWGGSGGDGARAVPRPPVTVAIAPAALEVIPLPCFSAGATLSLTNPGAEAIYADASVTGQSPLLLNRGAFSNWLPVGWTARAPVTVTARATPRRARASCGSTPAAPLRPCR